jgi:hypothetical protein
MVRPQQATVILCLALAAAAFALAQAPPTADLILHNARVYTMDASRPTAEAIAIRGDRIARVGPNTDGWRCEDLRRASSM